MVGRATAAALEAAGVRAAPGLARGREPEVGHEFVDDRGVRVLEEHPADERRGLVREPALVVERLEHRPALAPPDGRALWREPEPFAALLPVSGADKAVAAGFAGALPWLAAGHRNRHGPA